MRKRGPKIRRVTLHKDAIGNNENADASGEPHWRPATRADCAELPRPCPYVGCKYHLFLDFTPFGSIKFNFGDSVDGLDAMPQTCALDVADTGGQDMTKISTYLNVTPARTQQEVFQALLKLKDGDMRAHEKDKMDSEDS